MLLDSAVKGADGFFTTFFVSPYSRFIARWAARRGFTPNQVTTVSVFIGLLAAIAFATGERWGLITGAILLQAAFTTDCVDGQLARYTRQFSKLGAWLDSVFDRTKEYLAFAGLAIGASQMGDPVWLLACAAITLQTVRHMSDFSFGGAQQQVLAATCSRRSSRRATPPARRPRRVATARSRSTRSAAPRKPLPQRVLSAWHVSIAAGRALGEEDDRVPDRRAVRRDLAHRRAVDAAHDVHRAARLGRPRGRLHPGRPGAPVACDERAGLHLPVAVPPARPDPIAVYRDDGPLALALGRALGRWSSCPRRC